jgi:hypothetical protein
VQDMAKNVSDLAGHIRFGDLAGRHGGNPSVGLTEGIPRTKR